MSIFNIYDQAHLTRAVQVAAKSRLEQLAPVVRSFYTLVPTKSDKIKMERSQIKSFGFAKPKAFGATPPIYVPRMKYTETEVELIPIHEMSPIDERLLRKLTEPDPEIVKRAGADAVLRAAALRARNELGWDVLTMGVILTGQLSVLFADDPTEGLTIDYQAPPTNYSGVSVAWSNATLTTMKPIDDMRAVQLYLANTVGDYGVNFWMNSNTMTYLVNSTQAKELLTGFDGRAQFIPKIDDIAIRMYEPDRVKFNVSDSGYRPDETYDRSLQAHTKFIPDGKVIVTTDDPFEGEPLLEVYDGRVAVPRSEFAPPVLLDGAQAWVKLDTDSMTTYYHDSSARIPSFNRPDCVAVMDVTGATVL